MLMVTSTLCLPFSVPGQPLNFKAEPESETSILLSWTPPRSDTITNYELVYKDGEPGEEVGPCFSPLESVTTLRHCSPFECLPTSCKKVRSLQRTLVEEIYASKETLDQKNSKGIWRLAGGRGKRKQLLPCWDCFLLKFPCYLWKYEVIKEYNPWDFGTCFFFSSALKFLSHLSRHITK